MGDPAGIGGELVSKALKRLVGRSIPVVVGDRWVLDRSAGFRFEGSIPSLKPLGEAGPGEAEFLDLRFLDDVRPGETDVRCGEASYRYIVEGLKLVLTGPASAIVTCPINKKSIQSAGIPFIGHTEILAHYAGMNRYVMMMANRAMRVSLVTIHTPLRSVPSLVTAEAVFGCISVTARSLVNDFGIDSPFIKVCGLNPHAGEGGIMGDEEAIITEAIEKARACGIHADGPYPADSLFHRTDCDAFVAMYHDQGLIPVKTIDFRRTVNITLGLPIVRTSVGHGTGLDIAGQGIADPTSLIEAYRTAEQMAETRDESHRRRSSVEVSKRPMPGPAKQ
jgi:4-hydroxythreonine-4-phosphate dehydrogenase